ncbi:MAG: CHRD domain-containing protein [Bauldia sp.]|nr:CHRD domain-containing protein [Bauldia sp.]
MHTVLCRSVFAGLGLAVLSLLAATPASAQNVNYTAELTGAAEVPPVTTEATGNVRVSFGQTSKRLVYTITYSGLSGPATAAHFHGPAAADANAPPVIPIEGDLTSPISGSVILTDEQVGMLEGDQLYFNIHTAANPGGEIRGQVGN